MSSYNLYIYQEEIVPHFNDATVSGWVRKDSDRPERVIGVSVMYGKYATNLNKEAKATYYPKTRLFSAKLEPLLDGEEYFYRIDFIINESQRLKGEIHSFFTYPKGAIDLDLPSGKKWSSANLGTLGVWGPGDCFAWGETETKADYSWKTYKWAQGSSGYGGSTNWTITKYTSASDFNQSTLLDEDDACYTTQYIDFGKGWHIASVEDWKELNMYCDIEDVSRGELIAAQVSSKVDKSYKKVICIYFSGGTYNGKEYERGNHLWTSTLSEDNKKAYSVYYSHNQFMFDTTERTVGMNVRGVYVDE